MDKIDNGIYCDSFYLHSKQKKKKNSIQTCIGFVHMCANTVHQNLKTFATFIDSNGVWAVLIAIYCTNIKWKSDEDCRKRKVKNFQLEIRGHDGERSIWLCIICGIQEQKRRTKTKLKLEWCAMCMRKSMHEWNPINLFGSFHSHCSRALLSEWVIWIFTGSTQTN